MTPLTPTAINHRIEVSGWDLEEHFFVETTELEWSELGNQKVCLRRPLRDGSVVFVRLLHPTAPGPTFPIAYQVERAYRAGPTGLWEVCLVQLHPRPSAQATRSRRQKAVVEKEQK